MANPKDLTNQQFNRLKALKPTSERRNSSVVWECECSCENKTIVYVTARSLLNGMVKSCGCIQQEKIERNSQDLTGKTFEKLFVESQNIEKSKTDKISYWSYWNCICECDNKCVVATGNLTSGHTKSCGCIKGEYMKEFVKTEEGMKQTNIKDKLTYVEGTCLEFITDKKINSNNTSGHKGVYWSKAAKKWTAEITFKRKKYYLGLHEDKKDAIKTRKEAEYKIFGEFIEWYNENYLNHQ